MSAMRRQRGLQRLRVEPQRAVGQVVVVDQDQLAARNTLQRRNFRELALDVEFLAVDPHQLAGAVVVVDADGQPVHAGLARAGRRTALADGEPGELAVRVDVEVGAQRVEPGGLQPLLTPVATGRGPTTSPARPSRSPNVALSNAWSRK